MSAAQAEVARLFNAGSSDNANFGTEVYPGYPALVIAQGQARVMTWVFPLVLKGKQGQPLKPKPVNNAREDKLETPFWRSSYHARRCLIPVTAWAEAEGAKGQMTRTWYSVAGQEIFAAAGVCRPTHEWGNAFSMVMVDGNAQMADVHDRMPLLLEPESWTDWTDGSIETASQLIRTSDAPLHVDRTSQRWAR